jgi:hypothetical protein
MRSWKARVQDRFNRHYKYAELVRRLRARILANRYTRAELVKAWRIVIRCHRFGRTFWQWLKEQR